MTRYPVSSQLLSLVALANSLACGSNDQNYPTLDPVADGSAAADSGSSTGASTTTAASSSVGSTTTAGLVPGSSTSTSTTGSAPLEPGDVCAAVTLETEAISREVPREITTTREVEIPAPVAIYIVLDNSGSMDEGDDNGGGETKWETAEQALTDFVNDPASAGVDVAIQYFHPDGIGDDDAQACDGVAHATPAVGMAPLPANAAPIVDSLAATGPDGDTPTVGALTGGTSFCSQFQAQTPDEQCIVVLVTDGQPNGCGLNSDCGQGQGGNGDCVDPNSAAVLTPIASAGLASGVTTFAVGMQGVTADGFQLLNAIAIAGGSDCTPATAGAEACDVSATGGAGLLAALNTIRDTVIVTETITETTTETIVETVTLPCQWSMPIAPAGETIDPNLVNVVLEVAGTPETLGQVATVADCPLVVGGWYYDVPSAPTSIQICPQTCDIVEGNADVRVQVELGCATEPADPK